MTVRRIGLVVHGGRQAALDAGARVRRWATDHGIPTADIDVWDDDNGRLSARAEAEKAGHPDLIVTVGGDGTFLRGARVAAPIGALVLGVNVGRVGFLTEVAVDDLDDALEAVGNHAIQVDARMMLTMRASRPLEIPEGMAALLHYGRGPALPPPPVRAGSAAEVGWGVALDILALNDIVFEKLARDRQASVAVYVDSHLFASYSADGLIVSSPTGSTAYSFAAGGPILSPKLDALVFTPVAPHMVFNRSLVLSVEQRVAVRVLKHSGQVAVSVDGQLRGVLDPGDWVSVYAGPKRARLVRMGDASFLDRVRNRFGLVDAGAALADGDAPAIYQPAEPLPEDLAHPGPHDDPPA
ncbi:MAG TPA: NAD(+)/NADH kinase [Micromonosporaceae bacterium]|nr:NAD(+)/NADH kinase [Micromonosporaceae bacterium]